MVQTYDMKTESMVDLDPDDYTGRMQGLAKMAGRYNDMRGLIAMLIEDGEPLPARLLLLFSEQQAEIDDERRYSPDECKTRLSRMAQSARERLAAGDL